VRIEREAQNEFIEQVMDANTDTFHFLVRATVEHIKKFIPSDSKNVVDFDE